MSVTVNRKRIVVNTLFLYAKTLITMIISFIATRLVLEGLGAVDYGIFGTVGGAIVMLEALNGAMALATQRYMNYAEGKGDKENLILIFNNTVILHILLGVVIVLLLAALYYPFFNGVFNLPVERIEAAKGIYMFLIISAFFTIITVPYDALINAHEDFLYYSIVGIVMALLKLGAAIGVVLCLNDRLIIYGLLMTAISIINMLIMYIYCKSKYQECHFQPQKYADIAKIKDIGIFAGWNFVGALANMAGNHGSTILMNHFFGPILIAAKNIGDQICAQVAVLTNNMTKALNPVIVKSEGGGDRQTMINLSYKSCRFSFLLYLVLAVPFIFNAEPLLAIWLKEVPAWAALFCQLQVVRTLFEQLFTPLRMSLMAQGSVRQVNIVELVLGVITFLVLWVLYQVGLSAQWHYYISILVLVFISGIIKVVLCRAICDMNIHDYCRMVIIPCVLSMTLCVIVTLVIQTCLSNLHVLFIVSIQVIALFVIEVFLGLTKPERNVVFSRLRRNSIILGK